MSSALLEGGTGGYLHSVQALPAPRADSHMAGNSDSRHLHTLHGHDPEHRPRPTHKHSATTMMPTFRQQKHPLADTNTVLRICALMCILCARTRQTAVPDTRLDPTASLGTIVLTAHLGIQTRRSPAVHTHCSLHHSLDTKYIPRLLKVHMTFLIIFLMFYSVFIICFDYRYCTRLLVL